MIVSNYWHKATASCIASCVLANHTVTVCTASDDVAQNVARYFPAVECRRFTEIEDEDVICYHLLAQGERYIDWVDAELYTLRYLNGFPCEDEYVAVRNWTDVIEPYLKRMDIVF